MLESVCLHPWSTKQFENCFAIAITFLNVPLLYMPVGNCLPLLFYIICGYTAEQSFKPLIFSNVSLFSMTFCYGRKLPSKVVSAEDNQPFLKRSQQNTIFHVVQFLLWRFNWILRDQDKLSYRFYWYKISLSVDILLLGIFFSCNLLILGYSPGIEQSRIIYFHAWNTFIKLVVLGIYPPPGTNPVGSNQQVPSPIHCFMNPSYVGNAHRVFAEQWLTYIIFSKFLKTCYMLYVNIYFAQ